MGHTKTDTYTSTHMQLVGLLKALGHPARLAIVKHLAQQPGCQCGELVAALPLSQSTVSQHLAELKAAGILQGEVSGPRICYCLDPDALQLLQGFLQVVRNQLAQNNAEGQCC